MTYALALILPIVTTFFIAFGVLEDSGYLPRLSVIANRLFAAIGLNGRAIAADGARPRLRDHGDADHAHPALAPRTADHHLLLALAIPCSAQLGVVLGMLGGVSFTAVLTWALAMVGVLLLAGFSRQNSSPAGAFRWSPNCRRCACPFSATRAQENRRPAGGT